MGASIITKSIIYKNNNHKIFVSNECIINNEKLIESDDTENVNKVNDIVNLNYEEISEYIKQVTNKYEISEFIDKEDSSDYNNIPDEILYQQKMGFVILKETAEHFNINVDELTTFLSNHTEQQKIN